MQVLEYHTDLLENDVIISSKSDDIKPMQEGQKKYYIESYGCQMNVSDSEIVAAVLNQIGYIGTQDEKSADFIFLNTCSIRDKAEQTVRNRLKEGTRGGNTRMHGGTTEIKIARRRKIGRYRCWARYI